MYVCVCNAITESDIRTAAAEGVRNLKQLTRASGLGSACGCCKEMAVEVLQQALAEERAVKNLLPVMQLA